MQQFVFEMNDALYHNLMQKYGKDDIQEFGIRFFEMLTYSPKHAKQKTNTDRVATDRPYRLGVLPNINIPDDFDDSEIRDFDV
ncbi:MAG: hypothetical protein Q4A69_07360 [Moraxella sp.]|nr:hypothetical protein [Moraxella sp.]